MRKKGGRERKGERKKGTIQTDLGKNGRPLTLTTQGRALASGMGDSGTQSRNAESPSTPILPSGPPL